MSNAEASSWWDDVQHLRPESQLAPADTGTLALVSDDAPAEPMPVETELQPQDRPVPSVARRSPARASVSDRARPAPRLSRADAADFAEAFDIDGAFGAPSQRFAREPEPQDTAETHVIVLGRVEPELEDEERFEIPSEEDRAGRQTVRITGHPGQAVTPRRLQELERRPRRGAAERATRNPDRIALYAVLLGLLLVVIAAASNSAHP